MAEYRLTPKAVNDLRDIWHRIASENEPAADALVNRTFDKLELAAGMPLMGSPRPSLSARCRLLVEGNYVILYEPEDYGIRAIAIVSGLRDPDHWLK